MPVGIVALGTANPSCCANQQEVAHFMADTLQLNKIERRFLNSLYKATGIAQRYSVLNDFKKTLGDFEFFPNIRADLFPSTSQRMKVYQQHARPLAIKAIENCLATLTNFNKHEITHLITISCTGMYAPGIDIEIIEHLKLATSTQRIAIHFMGCYGAFNGIKVAEAICKADSKAKVLVVSVELCSIHFKNSKLTDDLLASAIFADGAGAALIQSVTEKHKYLSLEVFHSDILPESDKEMTWSIGDNGFDMVLSSYVPTVIQSGIATFVQKLLDKNSLMLANIDFYAIHPGGIKILQACEQALKITVNDNRYSYNVMRENGNMSSATILFVLKKIWEDLGEQNNQQRIFSCAFGPGLTLESMLLKINYV